MPTVDNIAVWFPDAKCKGHKDPNLFFDVEREREAKVFCRTDCAAQEQCLVWSMELGFEYGIFGGMTGPERKSEKRRRLRRATGNYHL